MFTFDLRLDRDALQLLDQLLKFESKNRVSAAEAMRSSFFSSLGQRILHLPDSEWIDNWLSVVLHV